MTGFSGRIGIYELLLMSPEMRQGISAQTDIAQLRDLATREGMKPLRISGALKVAAGVTTLEEVVKVAPPVD
jgi:general secretion pathway protein E